MKKFFIILPLVYLFFAITADFQVLKRGYAHGEEGSYILTQLSFGHELSESAVDELAKFYPKGGRIVLTWRGKPYVYSPWVYDYLMMPFFSLFSERGFYIFNAVFIFLSFLLLSGLFRKSYAPFFVLLGSSFPVFLILEGPYSLEFFLSSLLLYGFMKKNSLIIGISGGILAFFSPLFFFLVPLFSILGKKRPVLSSIISFSLFFALVFSGIKLGGSLPWDSPVLASTVKEASNFIVNPFVPIKTSFPIFPFLFGRFTGLFLYFPVVFLLVPKRKEWGYFITGLGLILIFLAINSVYAPFGFVGNPWAFPIIPLLLPLSLRRFSRPLILLSILSLSIILLLPLRCLSNPLLHTSSFPFNIFPPETAIIQSLPVVKIGENYHFDLNFFTYKGNSLRPRGKSRVEFIRLSSFPSMTITVRNLADENSISLKVNGSSRRLKLKEGESFKETFNGKIFGSQYLYRVILKPEKCRVYFPSKVCLGAELKWK